mgnify:FL=1
MIKVNIELDSTYNDICGYSEAEKLEVDNKCIARTKKGLEQLLLAMASHREEALASDTFDSEAYVGFTEITGILNRKIKNLLEA